MSRCRTGWRSSEVLIIVPQLVEVHSTRPAEGRQGSRACGWSVTWSTRKEKEERKEWEEEWEVWRRRSGLL